MNKILACEGRIRELKEKLEACTGVSHSGSSGGSSGSRRNNFHEALRAQGKKALYPFRRDSLRSLKDDLDSLQANLNTALHVYV